MKGSVFFPPPVLIIGKSSTALNWRKQLMRHAIAFKMKGEKKFPAEAKTQMARERRGKTLAKYNPAPPESWAEGWPEEEEGSLESFTETENGEVSAQTWRAGISPQLAGSEVKNLTAMQETQVQSLSREDPLEEKRQPIPAFLPGEFHGQRSLAGYRSWGRKESDATYQLNNHHHLNCSLYWGLNRACSAWAL